MTVIISSSGVGDGVTIRISSWTDLLTTSKRAIIPILFEALSVQDSQNCYLNATGMKRTSFAVRNCPTCQAAWNNVLMEIFVSCVGTMCLWKYLCLV
jgi:hypothetical protein